MMQVLKLVYIAHGWMLALHEHPLIRDRIEAWQYGPVIPLLYKKLRHFRSNPVKKIKVYKKEHLDSDEMAMIRMIYDLYGHLSALKLSSITHKAGSPWDLTYERGSFGIPISNDLIQSHYESLMDE